MAESYEGWAILELMGHRRLGGLVSQVEQYGVPMLRIDVPKPGECKCPPYICSFGDEHPGPESDCPRHGKDTTEATQFYGGSSIYCLTPTTEEMARAVALRNQPAPVQRWELPALSLSKSKEVDYDAAECDDDDKMGLK